MSKLRTNNYNSKRIKKDNNNKKKSENLFIEFLEEKKLIQIF